MQAYLHPGLRVLAESQQADGSWLTYSSPQPDLRTRPIRYRTTFSTAQILSCLNSVATTTEISRLKSSAADFMLAEKSPHWTWNYWARGSKEFSDQPYPDDADDTFCALAALWNFDRRVIPGDAVAAIVTRLSQIEVQPGGPYRTWFVPTTADPVWRDIDLAVNSNIAYFLSLQDVRLKGITQLLESSITAQSFRSPYYPNVYPLMYYLARSDACSQKEAIMNFLFDRQEHGFWENPLYTALCVSALIRLGASSAQLNPAVHYLKHTQTAAGWPAAAFCLDPAINHQPQYSGSPALTTAFCLEALSLHTHASLAAVSRLPIFQTEEQKIVAAATERFDQLGRSLSGHGKHMLEVVRRADPDRQIPLLPHFFQAALVPRPARVPNGILRRLGLANMLGWVAYTIYDDFYDAEGDPQKLGLANVCLREVTEIFLAIQPADPDFQSHWRGILDRIEQANHWEVRHCRFDPDDLSKLRVPSYNDFINVADKSMGHAIGPFAIMCLQGYASRSSELASVQSWFDRYLTARQLLDDLHDWEKDLLAGHLTAVNAPLVRQAMQARTLSTVRQALPEFRQTFWHGLMTETCEHVINHLTVARALLHHPPFAHPKYFVGLLDGLERSVRTSLDERQRAMDFLQSYHPQKISRPA